MKIDVQKYIRYYNHERLHTTLGDVTPVAYEKRNLKILNFSWPEHHFVGAYHEEDEEHEGLSL